MVKRRVDPSGETEDAGRTAMPGPLPADWASAAQGAPEPGDIAERSDDDAPLEGDDASQEQPPPL